MRIEHRRAARLSQRGDVDLRRVAGVDVIRGGGLGLSPGAAVAFISGASVDSRRTGVQSMGCQKGLGVGD